MWVPPGTNNEVPTMDVPTQRKTDRRCNNPACGARLTENAPNWFQCSTACMDAAWRLNNPPKQTTYDDDH